MNSSTFPQMEFHENSNNLSARTTRSLPVIRPQSRPSFFLPSHHTTATLLLNHNTSFAGYISSPPPSHRIICPNFPPRLGEKRNEEIFPYNNTHRSRGRKFSNYYAQQSPAFFHPPTYTHRHTRVQPCLPLAAGQSEAMTRERARRASKGRERARARAMFHFGRLCAAALNNSGPTLSGGSFFFFFADSVRFFLVYIRREIWMWVEVVGCGFYFKMLN